MFEKLVRFCRANGGREESETLDPPELAAPTVNISAQAPDDMSSQKPEPLVKFPDAGDSGTESSDDGADPSVPVFHISKDHSSQEVAGGDPSAAEGDELGGEAGSNGMSAAQHAGRPKSDLDSEYAAADRPESDAAGERETRTTDDRTRARSALPATLGSRALKKHRASEEVPNSVFSTYANPRLWRNSERSLSYVGEVTKLNREVFTPTRPKLSMREFVGRVDFVEAIVQAIEEERAHVVLFGHKSVGKTSVLNIISDSASDAGYLVARVMCTGDLTFDNLVRAIFTDLSAHLATAPAGPVLEKQLDVKQLSDLVDGDVSDVPGALRVFSRITGQQVIVLLDDFHRISDDVMKTKIRDFMSALSDKGAWVSFVIAGHGDITNSVDLLQGDIPSGTVTFELELMGPEEIAEIVERGGARLGIRFGEDVTKAIIQLSQGLPVVTQWLGLLTARRALRAYAENVSMNDLIEVTDEVSTKVSQRLTGVLDQVYSAGRSGWAEDLLFLAARTPIRRDGMFSTSDMRHEAHRAVGRSFSELNLHRVMAQFCDCEDESILEKIPTADGVRYRFNNPLMRAVIMLRNARRLGTSHGGLLEKVSDLGALPSHNAV